MGDGGAGRLLLALVLGLALTACSTTTAGTGSPAPAQLPVLQSRSAALSTPHGSVPVAVDLNEVRVVPDGLRVTFTARNTLAPGPGAAPWLIGGSFADGATAQDTPDTVDGVYVVDPVNARRHLPGRDPDGGCLCSSALAGVSVAPGAGAVLVATFAAPEPGVDAVDVVVPQAGEFSGVRVDPPGREPDAANPAGPVVFPEASMDGAVVERGNSIDMAADVMFEVDRAELTPRAGVEIVRVVGELRSTVLTRTDVVGYTDSTGSAAHNLALSRARAESVRAALAAALGPGVPVTAAGRGEADPVADNTTAPGRALNRRVRITYS